LELDEYHKLSGPLYVRSFLQTYAQYLALDPQKLIDRYHRLADAVSLEEEVEEVWEEDVQVRKVGFSLGRKGWQYLGLGVLLLILAFFIGRLLIPSGGTPSAGTSTQSEAQPEAVTTAEPPPSETVEAPPEPEPEPQRQERPAPARPAEPSPSLELPTVAGGDSTLAFEQGRTYPLVLRVLATGPVQVQVRQYGRALGRPISLPDAAAAPLPSQGIKPGRPYAVRDGHVLYWGAGRMEAFELRLSTDTGVEVRLNGHRLTIPAEMVGVWWLLDAERIP
jgi:cytoskeletal protein RodZ